MAHVYAHSDFFKNNCYFAHTSRKAIDEMAKLSRDSVDYFGQLSAEWRKLTLEATRKAAELLTFQG